jgi:prevent-host-death family protein
VRCKALTLTEGEFHRVAIRECGQVRPEITCPLVSPFLFLLNLATHDYHMDMKTVKIAELKSRLSEYLRIVRGGTPVTVLDRNDPIARIVPLVHHPETLAIRRPVKGHTLSGIKLPPPLKVGTDVLKVLMAERQGER